MYRIYFLYCRSNTLDAGCHTWKRNGRSDCPFTYSSVNQQIERWIEKLLMFGAWLPKEASNAEIGVACAFVSSEWSLSLPVESLGTKSNAQGHSHLSLLEGARADITLVGIMLLTVGGCAPRHTGVTVLSPLWHSSCPCRLRWTWCLLCLWTDCTPEV